MHAVDAALARIRRSEAVDGRRAVVGAGFLVAPATVCTCAHVVADAVGVAADGAAPEAVVTLDFPQLAPGRELRARVSAWRALGPRGDGDVAILTLLDDAPTEARAAPLADVAELWRHTFATAGFPAGLDEAVWATGTLQGRHGPALVQLVGTSATGYRVEQGFSGGPVWDETLGAVVGMVAAADVVPELRAAFMIPTRLLLAAHPELAALVSRPAARPPRRTAVPPAPANLVARPAVVARARQALLDTAGAPAGTHVLGLFGMPGAGKSVLATTLARDPAVVPGAFPDGVHWVSLGRAAPLLPRQTALLAALGERADGVADERQAAEALTDALAGRRVLVVLDDVWSAAQVRAFGAPEGGAAMLVTTRSRGLLASLGARECAVGELETGEALALLADWADVPSAALPAEAADVVRECGRLPLAIAMVGAALRGKPASRWRDLRARLGAADVAAISRAEFPDYPYPSVVAAMDVSVDALDDALRPRYLELAVFPEDAPIAEPALHALWGAAGLDRWAVQDAMDALVDASLAQRDEGGRLRLHDLQVDYVRWRTGADAVRALHARLLAAYRTRCADGWADCLDDEHLAHHLAHHLLAAGRRDELHALLDETSPAGGNRWFEAREARDDVAGYLADVELAWRDAGAAFADGAMAPDAALARELRCALAASSLHAVAEGIPAALLAAVARAGVWPLERCVAYVRHVADPTQRALGFGALLPLLGAEQVDAALDEALDALHAAAPADARERTAALEAIVTGHAAHRPDDAARLAIDETRPGAWMDAEHACTALAQLAAALPPAVRAPLVRTVGDRLAALPEARLRAVAHCAAVLPPGELPPEFTPLLEEAHTGAYALRRRNRSIFAMLLLDLAPHLPAAERARALDDALAELAGTPSDWADELPRHARRFGPAVVRRLYEAAARIPFAYAAAIARARLVALLPRDEREPAACEALAALDEQVAALAAWDTLSRDILTGEACALAPCLPAAAAAPLAERARRMDDARRRASALAALAAAAGPARDALAGEALDAAMHVANDADRRATIDAVLPVLPAALLPGALRLARLARDADHRLWHLHLLARPADPPTRERILGWALQRIGERGEDWSVAEALPHMRPLLPAALLPRALAMARALAEPRWRAEALATLAPLLPPADARQACADARAAAHACATALERGHALAALLHAVPDDERDALLAELLAAADELEEGDRRAELVARAAPALPPDLRRALVRRTLDERRDYKEHRRAMRELAPVLELAEAREVAEELEWMDRHDAGELAPALATRLAELGAVDEALALGTRFLREGSSRASDTIAAVAPRLALAPVREVLRDVGPLNPYARDNLRSALLPRLAELGDAAGALAVVAEMRTAEPLACALAGIAPHLPPGQRAPVLCRALDALADTNARALSQGTLGALGAAVAALPRADAHALLDRWLRAHAARKRAACFAAVYAMAPVLVALGGGRAVGAAWEAIEDVTRWWP